MLAARALERFRLGWTAATFDMLAALACYVAAYRLRFEGPDFDRFFSLALRGFPLMAGIHVAVLALLHLYRVRGQVLWPVRLVVGTVTGASLGFAIAVALAGLQGISRQATLGYVLLLVLAGLAWRAAIGLGARVTALRRSVPIGDEFEIRGEQFRSMSGGLLLALGYSDLLRNLVAKDLKLKYRGSLLGFVWSLANPLVMILVYTFAFTYVLKVPTERYPFFVVIGVLAWTFFAGAALESSAAIADGGSLIKSVVFPRVILPVSGVAFRLIEYLLSFGVLLPLLLTWYRIPVGAQMLLFPVFLLLQVLFITGVALLLSTGTAFMRDMRHLAEIGISVAFWATPIVYEHTLVPEAFRFAILLSPMASFIRAYQDMFYYLEWPDVSIWLVAITYGVGAFVCGLSVFVAYEDRFSEHV